MASGDVEKPGCQVRLLTWNVNGLRACTSKFQGGLAKMLDQLDADVVCFQEHKTLRKDLDQELAVVEGWESFFTFTRGTFGYSGVATFCRRSAGVPLHAEEGLTGILALPPAARSQALLNPMWSDYTVEQLMAIDQEGRAVITDHGEFVLINIYGPAMTNEEKAEERWALKRMFFKAVQARVEAYQKAGRRCIVAGDFNISPKPADFREPEPEDVWFAGDPSTSMVCWLRSLSHDGPDQGSWVDTFRLFHPDRLHAYTCWRMQTGARANNWGSRIDLILAIAPGEARGEAARENVLEWVVKGDVWPELQGSDHAPAWVTLQFPRPLHTPAPTARPLPLNSRNLFVGKQARLTQWFGKPSQPQLGRSASDTGNQGSGLSEGGQEQGAGPSLWSALDGSAASSQPACSHQLGESQSFSAEQDQQPQHQQQSQQQQQQQQQQPTFQAYALQVSSQSSQLSLKATQQPPRGSQSQPSLPSSGKRNRGGQRSGGGRTQALLTSFMPSRSTQQSQNVELQSSGHSQQGQGNAQQSAGQQGQSQAAARQWEAGSGPQDQGSMSHAGTTHQGWPPPGKHQHGLLSWPTGAQPASSSQQAQGAAAPHFNLNSFHLVPEPTGNTSVGPSGPSHAGPASHPQADPAPTADSQACPSDRPRSLDVTGQQQGEGGAAGSVEDLQSCPGSLLQHGSYHSAPQDRQQGEWGSGAAMCVEAGEQRTAEQGEDCGRMAGFGVSTGQGTAEGRGGADVRAEQLAAPQQDTRNAEAAKAWKSIQERMKAPHCAGHNEPAVIRQVKKAGPNLGRTFYVCARADGPPPVGRCDFFVWADNRGGGRGSGGRGAGGWSGPAAGRGGAPTKKPRTR